MPRLSSLTAICALSLAACAAPTSPGMPANLAAEFTAEERADLAEKTAELRKVLANDCTAGELDVIAAYLPYASLNLAAASDDALRQRLTADKSLTEQAIAARNARLGISPGCDTALRGASWGIL